MHMIWHNTNLVILLRSIATLLWHRLESDGCNDRKYSMLLIAWLAGIADRKFRGGKRCLDHATGVDEHLLCIR
jgi:hypothetical protein